MDRILPERNPYVSVYRLLFIFALVLAVGSAAVAQDRTSRIEKLMRQYHDEWGFIGTVIVAENCATVFSKGYGMADRDHGLPNGPLVHYRIASVSKTFTATMIMKLVEEGKIGLQDPISRYLPSYRRDTGEKVTIHHLLTHSSGIPNYVAMPEFRRRATGPMPGVDSLAQVYCSGNLEFEPGSRYSYSNSGYVLLGAIIESVTHQPYERALRTMILDPAGMSETGLDHHGLDLPARALGYTPGFRDELEQVQNWNPEWAYAAGGLYATPDDMVRWDQVLYDEVLVNRSTLKRMMTPYFPAFRGASYGYGFSLARTVKSRRGDSLLVMSHEGGLPGFNSLFSRIPATKHMVFVVSNTSNAPVREITQALFAILNGSEPDPVKRPLAREVYKAIEAKGLEAGLRAVESSRYADPSAYAVSEPELNALGYDYLARKMFSEAEAVFSLNVREFPKSWNTYDSLGECYAAMGERDKAVKLYMKSVELNPANDDGRAALRALGVSPDQLPGSAK